jgi:hypothetical protein
MRLRPYPKLWYWHWLIETADTDLAVKKVGYAKDSASFWQSSIRD